VLWSANFIFIHIPRTGGTVLTNAYDDTGLCSGVIAQFDGTLLGAVYVKDS
jgi:hypothetical protein